MAIADGEAVGRVKFEMTEVSETWNEYDYSVFLIVFVLANAATLWTTSCERRGLNVLTRTLFLHCA